MKNMKTKKSPQKEEKPLNSILGVNFGLPALSETGVTVMNAENIISAYEKEAQEILKRGGYPLTLEELWTKKDEFLPDLANGKGLSQVYCIFWMLSSLQRVRFHIEKKNADRAVSDMAIALTWSTVAKLKPIAPLIGISEKVIGGGKSGGDKSAEVRQEKARSTTEIEQTEADKIWRKHPTWGKPMIAEKVAEKIGGKPGTIRKHIKKPLP